MSSTQAVQPSTPVQQAGLLNSAAAFVQKFARRLVVPVASTEDMNDVWRLYRLTPAADPVRPDVQRSRAADGGR